MYPGREEITYRVPSAPSTQHCTASKSHPTPPYTLIGSQRFDICPSRVAATWRCRLNLANQPLHYNCTVICELSAPNSRWVTQLGAWAITSIYCMRQNIRYPHGKKPLINGSHASYLSVRHKSPKTRLVIICNSNTGTMLCFLSAARHSHVVVGDLSAF